MTENLNSPAHPTKQEIIIVLIVWEIFCILLLGTFAVKEYLNKRSAQHQMEQKASQDLQEYRADKDYDAPRHAAIDARKYINRVR